MAGRAQETAAGSRDAENNAPKVVYLCTEKGGQVTGQVIGTSGWQMSLYSPRHVIRTIHKDGRWTVDELEEFAAVSDQPELTADELARIAALYESDFHPAASGAR